MRYLADWPTGRVVINEWLFPPPPPPPRIPPGAVTLVALLPQQDAAALLAKASGSPQQQANSGWLIDYTHTLPPQPCSASPPPFRVYHALTLLASPAFQVWFGVRDSPACDATLSLLLSTHGGARALFTETVTSAVALARSCCWPAPVCLPERTLLLGGPLGWTLTVQPLRTRSASGCDIPALLVRHSFEDMSALMARAAERESMRQALNINQLDSMMVLTREGQMLYCLGSGSRQGWGCAGIMEQGLGAPSAKPGWLPGLFAAEPHTLDTMMSEVINGREWRYAGPRWDEQWGAEWRSGGVGGACHCDWEESHTWLLEAGGSHTFPLPALHGPMRGTGCF